AYRPGDLRVDRVTGTARRGGMVSFVEYEERTGPQLAEPVAQRAGVHLVDEETVRDQEARVGRPWVDPEATLLPHPRDVLTVEHDERETEARVELALPLIDHRWGARDDDLAGLLAVE